MTRPFVNWARTVRSQPRAWASPASEAEVVELVRGVREDGGRLKVAGSRHSWSAIAAGDDVQVTLGGLDGFVSLDADAGEITVGGGCPLHEINRVLDRHALALPILGSITEQTIAGAIATGTHGSSLHRGNLSSNVKRLRLVDGTGTVHDLGPDDPRLDAARVHLGALGVVTEVTLGCVPAFLLEERRQRLPLDVACERIHGLATDHAFCKLWWLPHTDEALVWTYEPTRIRPTLRRGARTVDAWVNRTVFPALLGAGGLVPPLIPLINRTVDRVHFQESVRVGPSHEVLTLVMPPRHREMEVAVPAEQAGEVLAELARWIEREGARLDFIVELRFVKGDGGWMSPAHGRDTAQLGLYAARSPDTDRAFSALRSMAQGWGARFHWGKELRTTPEQVRERWPRAEDFTSLARELDPDGVFRNPWLDEVLGPA